MKRIKKLKMQIRGKPADFYSCAVGYGLSAVLQISMSSGGNLRDL